MALALEILLVVGAQKVRFRRVMICSLESIFEKNVACVWLVYTNCSWIKKSNRRIGAGVLKSCLIRAEISIWLNGAWKGFWRFGGELSRLLHVVGRRVMGCDLGFVRGASGVGVGLGYMYAVPLRVVRRGLGWER
jgi:hypothetical protein